MDSTRETGLLAVAFASFRALPGWEKIVVVVACAALSPFLAFVGPLFFMALFPLMLAGRYEGDMGAAPLQREIAARVRRQQRRSERYYAT